MSTIKTFNTLYGKDKAEKIRVWDCKVVDEGSSASVVITHGTLDGKSTTSVREIKSGKNIGKKNETTAVEQAIKEAEKAWKDKVEKEEYRQSPDDFDKGANNTATTAYAPMLAEKFDPNSKVKRKVDIVFPCYIQPKLDGIRCLSFLCLDAARGSSEAKLPCERSSCRDLIKGKVVNQSRKLKPFFHLDHINAELESIFTRYPNIVFDGELYNHDISFNQIAGIVKKIKCSDEDIQALKQIQYHIYDNFIPQSPESFTDRLIRLQAISKLVDFKYIKFVSTSECNSSEQLTTCHAEVTSKGYEGIMLRNKSGPYEHSRSRHLQKYKTFMDDEFKVVGYHEGTGNDVGCVVWTCKAKNGSTFDVRPQGTVESRQEWFKNAKNYIGKMLTVKYQELSEYGIPRFPVGLAFRDYE